jgi:phage terminase large subunit-like protein
METKGEDRAHYAGWVHDGYITAMPGNRIDYEFIQQDIEAWAKQFDLTGPDAGGGEVCNDQWNAQQLISNLEKKQIFCTEIPQTVQGLSEPMKELDAVIRDGKLKHDGNPVTYWCFANTMARDDKKDNVFPFKEGVENKIDGCVATINAMARAMYTENGGSVYSERGMLIA